MTLQTSYVIKADTQLNTDGYIL